MNSIIEYFQQNCARHPDKRCIVWQGKTYTYADIQRGAHAFAQALVEWGLQRGDRVALFMENSIDFVYCYLGVGMARGTVVLVNTQYRQVELRHILSDSGARICVSSGTQHDELARVLPDLPHLERVVELGADMQTFLSNAKSSSAQMPFPATDDVAIIAYTSGTTGRSKGAMLLHRNLVANAESVTEAWRWTSSDHLLHMLPLFHAHGLMVGIHGTLLTGASCELHKSFNADIALERLSSGEFTMFFGVPTMYVRLINDVEAKHIDTRPLRNMRLFVSGSAALSPQTHADFQRLFGHNILERYGMTETIMNMTNPFDGERRAGTVGKPYPRQEGRIVDVRTRAVLGANEIGEIEVRGGHVFSGYLNRPEATAESFTPDGWFKTGDLGKVSADGYFTITGRAKELIISGGYNIYPREVEEVLGGCPGVREVAVFGLPDAEFGEHVCAVVVRNDPTLTAEALIAYSKDQLASYKKPRKVVFMDALPRNAMGKVVKHELAQQVK